MSGGYVTRNAGVLMGFLKRVRKGSRAYVFTLAGVAAAAVVSERLDQVLNTLNISLTYLFVVLVVATTYGYGPAIVASVLGVLSFYFEFYPPYGINSDLQVADWLTLLFFLAFAIATSRLASSARARAEEARARAAEAQARQRQLALLHQLDEVLRVGNDLPALLEGIVGRVHSTLDLACCRLSLRGHGSIPPGTAACGSASGGSVLELPLEAGEGIMGVLLIEERTGVPPLDDTQRLAMETFARQAAIAIERTALATDAHQAAVLREADRLKTALLRVISHDLRTPLATIKARASNMLEGDIAMDSEDWRESLQAIDTEADRLERLVAEVLEMSRIEAGALTLLKEPYTADEVVSAVLPHLETAAGGHHLVVDVPEDLPPVNLDIALISRVLANLLENAFKYAPAGTRVRLSAAWQEGGLILRVEDQGPGIPPELRERVFDSFYRLDRATERGRRGMGLGLAICRGLVQAHGGRIYAEHPEFGAAFTVWLPGEARAAIATLPGPALRAG